jgi:hypothetical protein
MTLPARPRGIRGEVLLLPGVFAALPLTLLGAVIARRLSIVLPLIRFRDEPLDLEIIQFLWLTFGLELLVCLALAGLCTRLLLNDTTEAQRRRDV